MSRFFFFNDTATTEIYTLSLHDALPIFSRVPCSGGPMNRIALWMLCVVLSAAVGCNDEPTKSPQGVARSEEHTSELQSRQYLVCRLLLEKKKEASMVRGTARLCPRR